MKARHIAVLFCPLLLITACASGQQQTARRLNNRLQAQLAEDIAAGNAALQSAPDGARVTLFDTSLFWNDQEMLNSDPRAKVIEAMLDPSLMRVEVADSAVLSEEMREARVRNVNDYFVYNGLGSTLQPTSPQITEPASGAPAGLMITIGVQCPDHHPSYISGLSQPVCD